MLLNTATILLNAQLQERFSLHTPDPQQHPSIVTSLCCYAMLLITAAKQLIADVNIYRRAYDLIPGLSSDEIASYVLCNNLYFYPSETSEHPSFFTFAPYLHNMTVFTFSSCFYVMLFSTAAKAFVVEVNIY